MKLICTLCPQGCELKIDQLDQVQGNRCPRGAAYALEEKTAPKRTLTTTLAVVHGDSKRVSIKSQVPILLKEQEHILKYIHKVCLTAPLHVGDLIYDLGGSQVNFLITSEVDKL